MAHGSDTARGAISSCPRIHFVNDEKIIYSILTKTLLIWQNMTYFATITMRKTSGPRQMFCITLRGPRTEKFGDLWSKVKPTIAMQEL